MNLYKTDQEFMDRFTYFTEEVAKEEGQTLEEPT